jgi:hypothetical protein
MTENTEAKVLTVTFADEAWEYFYGLLEEFTKKQLAVRVDDQDVELIRIEPGNIFAEDEHPVLIAHPYDESTKDWAPTEVRIPLYQDGQLSVTRLHLF